MSDVAASVAGGDVAAAGVAHAVVVGVGYVAVARALMLWILLGASEMIRFRYFFQVQAACPTRDKRHTLLLLPLVRRD